MVNRWKKPTKKQLAERRNRQGLLVLDEMYRESYVGESLDRFFIERGSPNVSPVHRGKGGRIRRKNPRDIAEFLAAGKRYYLTSANIEEKRKLLQDKFGRFRKSGIQDISNYDDGEVNTLFDNLYSSYVLSE